MSINYENWKRTIAVVLVMIIGISMMPVNIAHAAEESVTAISTGYENVLFSNGYQGYCIDRDLHGARNGDAFIVVPTSEATDNMTGNDISQPLKVLFTQCFTDIFVSDGNGGYCLSADMKNPVLGVAYHFSEGQYVWGTQKQLVDKIKAYTGSAIPDNGYVLTLETGEKVEFHFQVLKPRDTSVQYFFTYYIDVTPKDSHNHEWSQKWFTNDNQHWHECDCGEKTDVANHDMTVIGKVTNDCLNNGYTGDTVCKVCDKIIDLGSEIPALGHDMSDWYVTVEATCATDGKKRSDCSRCEYYDARPITMLGHDIVIDEAVAPTCTNTGLMEGEHCTCCEYKLPQASVEPLGHDMGEWYTTTPVTCTSDGEERRDCQRDDCEYFEIRSITMLGHDIVIDEAVAPACEKTGLTEGEHCTRCEYKVEQEIVDALLHDFWDLVVVREPTCTTPGEGIYHCQRDGCDATELYEILPTLHIPVIDKAVPATCTSSGLTEGSHCETCGAVIVEQTEIPALGHDIVIDEAVAPACEKTGLTEGEHCTRCEYKIEQEIVDALLHDFWDLVIVREPTCTTPGEGIYHCQREDCEATELYEILPTLHIPVIDEAVPATCSTPGLTEGSHCETCDTVIVEQTEIPALEHLPILKDYKNPTYEEVGYTGDTVCSSCNEIIEEGEIIPRLTPELPDEENVQTGDSKIFVYISLMIFSIAGIATLILFKKKRNA